MVLRARSLVVPRQGDCRGALSRAGQLEVFMNLPDLNPAF